MAIKVRIDRDECIICGVCWDSCPDVFEPSPEDELSQVVEKYQVDGDPALGEIPDNLEDCATEGAEGCPVEIIHLTES